MRAVALAFVAGLVFAAGLALSGMSNPAKVTGFLDVTGDWDPSLALVMLGAIGVYMPGWKLARRRRKPVLADRFDVPMRTEIDRRLVGGAAVFGIGWGLVGLCPGPALVALSARSPAAWLFAAGMVAAMVGYERVRAMRAPAET